jgi:hypothetical protein
MHGRGERLVRPVDGEQRERADDLRRPDEPPQLVQGEGGLAEGEGVAADEREGVIVVEGLRLGNSGEGTGVGNSGEGTGM